MIPIIAHIPSAHNVAVEQWAKLCTYTSKASVTVHIKHQNIENVVMVTACGIALVPDGLF